MTRSNSTSTLRSLTQPIDRVAIVLIVALSLLIGILLLSGNHASARVRDFSWQNKQVGADDTAFTLTFSRPMNHASVESNLRIEPPLLGKVSWAGRRMAYTLNTPAPYGTQFQVQLQKAQDRFTGSERGAMQPFTGTFQTHDRAFAYIGVSGEEAGRLILFNLNQQQKQILTPKEMVVMDFKAYPQGERLLFAAAERTTEPTVLTEQKLYTVTTGIHVDSPIQPDAAQASPAKALPSPAPAGTVALVLDNKDYQNLKFDLSVDGNVIVVQRVNRKNPNDFGPWLMKTGEGAQPLKGEPGGDFLITPDSNSLAIAQGQGLAILPLQPNAKPLDFLPKFGMVLSFARDGSLATMVKFNTDNTRSLFLVGNQNTQKELLRTTGSILSTRFDPTKKTLYCLLTELLTGGNIYQEQPYLAAIDLKTSKLHPLVMLPNQRDVQVSLAPDGLALLFDQTTEAVHDQSAADGQLRDSTGNAIASSRLWLLPLDPANPAAKLQPESLPLPGLRPLWLP
ncbi:hypothetical protein [Stenomitos frigidus]|uniref:SbsA Ig-like domain-containing protein n=1 Tax=Stenomitos frigidus ULC18 TaxID=2107698 RepID=A0A2T1E858_9CYAN|nr:hypothetical protein [Stenomitos frigidus]PSB28913.1 hypothetical protein C7B82_12445 [Stenomitos frigidus ULC18]